MEKISAPWTAQQVADLNHYQRSGSFHPFTCGGDRDDAAHRQHKDESGDPDLGLLVAEGGGWRCPACAYTQKWAWAFMAGGEFAPPVTPGDRLVRTDLTVTAEKLREVLGMDDEDGDGEALDAVIGCCRGEWRREATDLWRAWDHADQVEDDDGDDVSDFDPHTDCGRWDQNAGGLASDCRLAGTEDCAFCPYRAPALAADARRAETQRGSVADEDAAPAGATPVASPPEPFDRDGGRM